MKTRSAFSILSACAAAGGALVIPALAGFTVSGPGADEREITPAAVAGYGDVGTTTVTINLGEVYNYEVTGFQYAINAVAPVGASTHSSGKFRVGNSYVNSETSVAVYVNDRLVGSEVSLTSQRESATTGDSTVSSALAAIQDQDVTLKFVITSNSANPDGYVIITGDIDRQSPKPEGELYAPGYVDTTVTPNPTIGWKISMSSLSTDSSQETAVEVTEPSSSEGNDGWSGTGKSNNGHGNNLDGVDVSNPGKGKGGPNAIKDTSGDSNIGYHDSYDAAAAAYEAEYGSAPADGVVVEGTDENGDKIWYIDDEGKGGGAYPSQN